MSGLLEGESAETPGATLADSPEIREEEIDAERAAEAQEPDPGLDLVPAIRLEIDLRAEPVLDVDPDGLRQGEQVAYNDPLQQTPSVGVRASLPAAVVLL